MTELRLQLYRRIAGITHAELLDEMRKELVDRFGKDERERVRCRRRVENLFFQIRVKILATRAGVERIGRDTGAAGAAQRRSWRTWTAG
jgi:transcription-repair coupling factor (superfamily II helicase)